MGIYGNPKLQGQLSHELKARMQGKSCFNFNAIDKALFDELADVTESSISGFQKSGYIS